MKVDSSEDMNAQEENRVTCSLDEYIEDKAEGDCKNTEEKKTACYGTEEGNIRESCQTEKVSSNEMEQRGYGDINYLIDCNDTLELPVLSDSSSLKGMYVKSPELLDDCEAVKDNENNAITGTNKELVSSICTETGLIADELCDPDKEKVVRDITVDENIGRNEFKDKTNDERHEITISNAKSDLVVETFVGSRLCLQNKENDELTLKDTAYECLEGESSKITDEPNTGNSSIWTMKQNFDDCEQENENADKLQETAQLPEENQETCFLSSNTFKKSMNSQQEVASVENESCCVGDLLPVEIADFLQENTQELVEGRESRSGNSAKSPEKRIEEVEKELLIGVEDVLLQEGAEQYPSNEIISENAALTEDSSTTFDSCTMRSAEFDIDNEPNETIVSVSPVATEEESFTSSHTTVTVQVSLEQDKSTSAQATELLTHIIETSKDVINTVKHFADDTSSVPQKVTDGHADSDVMINEVTSSKTHVEESNSSELLTEEQPSYGDKNIPDSKLCQETTVVDECFSSSTNSDELYEHDNSLVTKPCEKIPLVKSQCLSTDSHSSEDSDSLAPIFIPSARLPLDPRETHLIKLGTVKECSVTMHRLEPKIIRDYVLGRMLIDDSGKEVRQHLLRPSLHAKILKAIESGLTQKEICETYGISASTVDRHKQLLKTKKRKALKLICKQDEKFTGISKRALTFSTRVKIMGKLERGVSIEALSHEYGINKSTLRTLRCMKNQKLKENQNTFDNSCCSDSSDSAGRDQNVIIKQDAGHSEKKPSKVYRKPKASLSSLMMLLLQNTERNCLTYLEFKRLISFVFPFYYKEFKQRKWGKLLWNATSRGSRKFFVKSHVTQALASGSIKSFVKIMLNPEEETNWKKYLEKEAQSLRQEAEDVMRRPELLESLLLGIVRFDTWKITDEDVKMGLQETEYESQASTSDGMELNMNNTRLPDNKNMSENKHEIKRSSEKRKNECDSQQSNKHIKGYQCDTNSDSPCSHGSDDSGRLGATKSISESFVNSRLVDLLMGKEKLQSGIAKYTSVEKDLDSKKIYPVCEKSDKRVRPSSPITVETSSSMPSVSVIAKGSETNTLSIISQPSTSSMVQTQSDQTLKILHDDISIKLETSPSESNIINSGHEESEESCFGKIVSVEDRAYHLWSSKDTVSPEKCNLPPVKENKESCKTLGSSLLSITNMSGSKTHKSVSEVFNCEQATSDSYAGVAVVPVTGTGNSETSHHVSIHSKGEAFKSPSPQSSSAISQKCNMANCPPHPGNISCDPQCVLPQSDLDMEKDPGNSHIPFSQDHTVCSHPPSTSTTTNMAPIKDISVHMGLPNSQPRNTMSISESSHIRLGTLCNSSGGTVGNSDNTNGQLVCFNRPLPARTSTPEKSPQTATSSSQSKVSVSVPQVASCIEAWKKVFPWMYYLESERTFNCEICEWGTFDRKYIEVCKLRVPKDVYSVAGQLRCHRENLFHRTIAYKKDRVRELYIYSYPVLKDHMQEIIGFDDILKTVTDFAGGKFPGPQESPQKEYFMSFMIKHIAECVEENLLKSLSESPFFSVVTAKDKTYSVVRWLNKKGESEEHFFCSQIGFPGECMSFLTYLKRRNVNMSKLISYSILSNVIAPNMQKPVMLQVPVRYPPLSVCLEWVCKTRFVKNLFQQLTVLTKLIKTTYHKFAAFPEAADFGNIDEPYAHNCVVNEKIMNFFFGNVALLRKIASDIYNTTGNMEAYGFSALELQEYDSMIRCANLLTRLHAVMSLQNTDSHSLHNKLNDFRREVTQNLSEVTIGCDEYTFLMLIDVFVSHVLLTLISPGKEITDIFSKKLKYLSSDDLQKIFPNLMSDYPGSSNHCLKKFHELRMQLNKSRDCSVLQLLAILISKPELSKLYPELYSLYQKITVLPFLHAYVEQCMFSVAAAEVFLMNKVEKRLMLPAVMILLEGPAVDQMEQEYILSSWSKKWKFSSLHKNL